LRRSSDSPARRITVVRSNYSKGKIINIPRRTEGGFAVGYVDIDGLGEYYGEQLRIDIQNESSSHAVTER